LTFTIVTRPIFIPIVLPKKRLTSIIRQEATQISPAYVLRR